MSSRKRTRSRSPVNGIHNQRSPERGPFNRSSSNVTATPWTSSFSLSNSVYNEGHEKSPGPSKPLPSVEELRKLAIEVSNGNAERGNHHTPRDPIHIPIEEVRILRRVGKRAEEPITAYLLWRLKRGLQLIHQQRILGEGRKPLFEFLNEPSRTVLYKGDPSELKPDEDASTNPSREVSSQQNYAADFQRARYSTERDRSTREKYDRDHIRVRERDPVRVRERDGDRMRERDGDRLRERDSERSRDRDTERYRDRDSDRPRERDGDRVRERETDRLRDREMERLRLKEEDKPRERDGDRQRERVGDRDQAPSHSRDVEPERNSRIDTENRAKTAPIKTESGNPERLQDGRRPRESETNQPYMPPPPYGVPHPRMRPPFVPMHHPPYMGPYPPYPVRPPPPMWCPPPRMRGRFPPHM